MQNGPPDSPRSGRSLGGSEVVKGSSASLVDPLSGSVVVPEAVLSNALPTLHEDAEFTCPSAAGTSSDVKALPLTLSALHLTEKKRALMNFEARPLPGSFAGYVKSPSIVHSLVSFYFQMFHPSWAGTDSGPIHCLIVVWIWKWTYCHIIFSSQ
jgi:hypothetical protein